MFHESLKKQFNWNLILKYTVKLTLNYFDKNYNSFQTTRFNHTMIFFKLTD